MIETELAGIKRASTDMVETEVTGVKTVAAGVVVYLTRHDIDSPRETVDLDGPEYALYLQSDLKDELERQNIHARVMVLYDQQNEPNPLDTMVMCRKASDPEHDRIKTIVSSVRLEAWQRFLAENKPPKDALGNPVEDGPVKVIIDVIPDYIDGLYKTDRDVQMMREYTQYLQDTLMDVLGREHGIFAEFHINFLNYPEPIPNGVRHSLRNEVIGPVVNGYEDLGKATEARKIVNYVLDNCWCWYLGLTEAEREALTE